MLERDDARTIHTFAHLCDDLVAVRQDCEVVLYRIEPPQLTVCDRLISLDLGGEGTLQRVFDGRWFVISNDAEEVSWLFTVEEGKLQLVHRLEGFLDELNDIYGPIPGDTERLGLTLWTGRKKTVKRGILQRPAR